MTVAAVIPHWNRADLLKTLLAQLPQQTRQFDRVIVVDNGSTDGSAELAEGMGTQVVRLPENLGFAAAVNCGVAEAETDWVAILNNDVELDRDWLRSLLDAVMAAPDAAFGTGKILSARDRSTLDGAWDEVSRGACAARIGSGSPDSPAWSEPRRVRMASLTACLVRRNLFADIGPLDARFGSYLEDVDFGLRAAKQGYWGLYVPSAVAYHQGSATWGAWSPDTVQMLARNQILLTAKHFRGQSRWPILVGQLLWGLLALRHGCGAAWMAGRRAGRRLARSFGDETSDPQAFAALLRDSEAEILKHQHDTYWRVYRWLAPL